MDSPRIMAGLMGFALHPLDWIVIGVYFALIVAVGLWAGRKVKGTDDYFLGDRAFSVWLVIGQAFGVGTHAEMPVSLAGKVYQSGYAGIWYQWKNLFITPFYWLLAPMFRRFQRTTTGEVYEDRYGSWMGLVYTIFALSYFIFNMGAMLKGAGKLVAAASGGAVTPNTVVIVMTGTFLIYSFVGGLVSAAYTDFVQSFFIIALSFLLIPLGLAEIGGFTGVRETLSSDMLSMVTPGDVGVFTIFMLTINGLIGIVAQPHILASVGTGQNEYSCRMGMAAGNFVKRFCTIGWALAGIIVAVMLIQRGAPALADPEDAFGYATRELLFPGAVGLMIASVLGQYVYGLGFHRRRRRSLHPKPLPPLHQEERDRQALPLGGPYRGPHHDHPRRSLRALRRQRPASFPLHGNHRRLHGHLDVRRRIVAPLHPLGSPSQPTLLQRRLLLAHLFRIWRTAQLASG